MKTPHTLAGSLVLFLLSLVVLGLVIAPAGASPVSWAEGNATALHSNGTGHPPFAKNGTWQRDGHAFVANATLRQERLQSLVTKLQGQGVDTSQLQTAIQNNDSAAIKSWLQSHATTNKSGFTQGAVPRSRHALATNTTAQQEHLQSFVTKLQAQGVDISGIQTALQNHDTATVTTWLKSYFESHPGTAGNSTHRQWHRLNQTATRSG